MNNNVNDVDLLDQILGCGLYQVLHSLVYQWIIVLLSSNIMMMAFLKKTPNFWICPQNDNFDRNTVESVPVLLAQICAMRKNESESCQKWIPAEKADFYSIVPEFQLICDRSSLVYIAISVQMAGIFIGSPLGGQLSDWYGRKWVLFGSLLSVIIFGNLSAWSWNIEMFIGLRFLVGIGCGIINVVNIVYITEFLLPKHRLWVTSVGSWPMGAAFLTLFAWASGDWKKLNIWLNSSGIPIAIILLIMQESPRWSLRMSKRGLSIKSVSFVVKMNRKTSVVNIEGLDISTDNNNNDKTDQLVDQMMAKTKPKIKYHLKHMFANKDFTIYTIAISLGFCSVSIITYVFLFDSDSLVGNHFLNFFIMTSLLRFLSCMATILADMFIKPYGRRAAFSISLSLITLSSLAMAVACIQNFPQFKLVQTVLSFFTMGLTSPIYITLGLSNTELYPTPIRNLAIGYTQVFNRLGAMIAPQLLYMASLWQPFPYLICGLMGFISCVLWLKFIPETKGKNLPDEMPS